MPGTESNRPTGTRLMDYKDSESIGEIFHPYFDEPKNTFLYINSHKTLRSYSVTQGSFNSNPHFVVFISARGEKEYDENIV